jgi:hypothetical protein
MDERLISFYSADTRLKTAANSDGARLRIQNFRNLGLLSERRSHEDTGPS